MNDLNLTYGTLNVLISYSILTISSVSGTYTHIARGFIIVIAGGGSGDDQGSKCYLYYPTYMSVHIE